MIDSLYEMACNMRFVRSQCILISMYFVRFIFSVLMKPNMLFWTLVRVHIRCYPKVPEILVPQLNHLPKFLFASIPFEVLSLRTETAIPSGFFMIGRTVRSHFASASSSRPTIRSGSSQCCQNAGSLASISSSGIGKTHRGRGPVSREGSGWLSYS